MNKFVIITDIPTPYRVYFFSQLYRELLSRNIQLEVLFFANSVPIRYWKIDTDKLEFPSRVVRGVHLHIGSNSIHFNPAIVWSVLASPPKWLLVGGGWHMPTCFLSILVAKMFCSGRCITMLWAEANKYSTKRKHGIAAFIRRIIVNSVDMLAVPGQMAIDTIRNEWNIKNQRFILLPNLIDDKKFFNSKKLNTSKVLLKEHAPRIKVSSEDIILLWPARLHENTKGILNFLIPVKSILSGSDLKILIAGEGPDKTKIERWIADNLPENVFLVGQKSEPEMLGLYSVADVLLLPSLSDPNPLSVIEGLWSSLPLLISKHCGNHIEAVNPNCNGWVIDPLSIDSIRSAVLKLKGMSRAELKIFGENSLAIAQKNFASSMAIRNFTDSLRLSESI